MKNTRPPLLKKGDKVAIIAPARKITNEEIAYTINFIKSFELVPIFGANLFASCNQFAGSDENRIQDLQWALDNPELKAVISARGGYGCMRIIDQINLTELIKSPKWCIGFSDFTVVLNHFCRNAKLQCLHAQMPINFELYKESAKRIFDFLLQGSIFYNVKSLHSINPVKVSGELIGGNLSLLYALQGSLSEPDYINKILFLEDLDEYLYHIDRMLLSMKRAGKFSKLRAIVIGGFTQIKDNSIPFGKTINQIITEHFSEYQIPVFFDFPAGHIENNFPIIIGGQCEITPSMEGYIFKQ